MASCQDHTPGPAFALPSLTGYEGHDISKNRAPAFSLGLRTHVKGNYSTPGPYNVGNVDRNGRYPYLGWTMESKAGVATKVSGPGPQSYAPEKMKIYTPAYSLGLKLGTKNAAFGPSPADYYPQMPTQGGITIGSARKTYTRVCTPGLNPAVPIDLYKSKAPAYSLGLKGPPMFHVGYGPGPKYHPGRAGWPGPHAYSFGLKHSRCAPPLITHEDN